MGYFSRKSLPYQRKYSVSEKELLAIIEATEYWHHNLYGRHFTIKTDHKPLKYLNSHKKINTRIMNWAMRLNQYDYSIEYIKGENNVEAVLLGQQYQNTEGPFHIPLSSNAPILWPISELRHIKI